MRTLWSKDDLEIGKIYGMKGFKGVHKVRITYFDNNDTEIRYEVVDENCTKGLRSGFHQCHLREKLYQLTSEKYDKN